MRTEHLLFLVLRIALKCRAKVSAHCGGCPSQLTKNVSGTFGFGCMKVWLNLTLLERNAYVRHWAYKCLVEPNILKTLFKYSDPV